VAIARALLSQPRVLVLDNATGNLDALTEQAVVGHLQAEGDGAPTRLLVAYRPTVLRLADEIVVLDEGRIVEHGTHEDLVARSARYRDLVGLA
jgi:ATP-binding cassette subfamily B protein